VRRRQSAGGNGGVPDASFGSRIRVSRIAKPSPFIDQAPQAASPLPAKFVDVVSAHLIDDEKHDELGPLG
jgi:hypothetical protein